MAASGWFEPDEGKRGGERLVTLDFIRGIAVLGILFANIAAFAQPDLAAAWPGALPHAMDGADRAVWLAQFLLIDGKMRGLFAVLFGAGIVLFTEAKGDALQWRRLVFLGLFGLAHYFLLFRGDILFSYALCGIVVLAMGAHRLPARTALAMGAVLYLLGAVFQAVPMLPGAVEEQRALATCADALGCFGSGDPYWKDLAATLRGVARESAVMRGSLRGIVAYNVNVQGSSALWGAFLSLFESFPAMLMGIGLYRYGLFDGNVGRKQAMWGLAGIALGLALTLPLAILLMRAGDPLYLTYLIVLGPAQAARLPMVLGLAVALAWLAPRAAGGWLGKRFVAAGRTAFSNYLGTSLAMAIVFQGWGFGLFGQLDRVQMLIPVALGCAAMLAWPAPWLRRFAYGPLEWLWRCLTYGRIFPLTRAV